MSALNYRSRFDSVFITYLSCFYVILIFFVSSVNADSSYKPIIVDGNASDWSDKAPVVTDPEGDDNCGTNTDIKSLYLTTDDTDVYFMVETYGKPIHSDVQFDFFFDYKPGKHITQGRFADINILIRQNSLYAYDDNDLDGNPEIYPISNYEISRGNVLEVKIPLSEIENASFFKPDYFLTVISFPNACDSAEYDFSTDPDYQIEIDYVLTINDSSSETATVIMTVNNIANFFPETFEIIEHGQHGIAINAKSLTASSSGTPLIVEHFPDSGPYNSWYDQKPDIWRIHSSGSDEIVIQYIIKPNILGIDGYHPEYRSYIAPEFAVFQGEHCFLVPKDMYQFPTTVSFNLPNGWEAYTPWIKQGIKYAPTLPGENPIESLVMSSFALGKFDIYSRMIGSTQVDIASFSSWPIERKEALAKQAFEIFAYQTSIFGTSIGEKYLIIFCPQALDGNAIYIGEWSSSQGAPFSIQPDGSYQVYWNTFAHHIFHRWNAWAWGFISPVWVNEGPNVLYERKTITKLQVDFPFYDMVDSLQRHYLDYLANYVSTGNDKKLSQEEQDRFIIYNKGEMVFFLIAKEIYLRTDGETTLARVY